MRQNFILLAIVTLFVGLLAHRMWSYATARYESHAGLHASHLISLGDDRYHAEIVFTNDGLLKLYLLDHRGSRPVETDHCTLTAYVTTDGEQASHAVELEATPQMGDSPGKASCFVGTLPAEIAGQARTVTVPNFMVGRERFHMTYQTDSAQHLPMPTPVAEAEEQVLYLTSGGKYTAVDIAANGRSTPSQKYRVFRARHDFVPQPGDALCPVTRTKANPACTWIVAGQTYQFCCPPCIDEFVRLAKEKPDKVRSPSEYVMP